MKVHRLRLNELEIQTIKKVIWFRIATLSLITEISEEEKTLYHLLNKIIRNRRGRTPRQSKITKKEIKELVRKTAYLVPPQERKEHRVRAESLKNRTRF